MSPLMLTLPQVIPSTVQQVHHAVAAEASSVEVERVAGLLLVVHQQQPPCGQQWLFSPMSRRQNRAKDHLVSLILRSIKSVLAPTTTEISMISLHRAIQIHRQTTMNLALTVVPILSPTAMTWQPAGAHSMPPGWLLTWCQ